MKEKERDMFLKWTVNRSRMLISSTGRTLGRQGNLKLPNMVRRGKLFLQGYLGLPFCVVTVVRDMMSLRHGPTRILGTRLGM